MGQKTGLSKTFRVTSTREGLLAGPFSWCTIETVIGIAVVVPPCRALRTCRIRGSAGAAARQRILGLLAEM